MKKSRIAIDLGTTNTVAAQWNYRMDAPEILNLEGVSRGGGRGREIDDSFTIPSCTYLVKPAEFYRFPFNILFRNFRSRTGGFIGRAALENDGGSQAPHFVSDFKSYLGKNSFRFIGRLGKWKFNADDITMIFLRRLLLEIKKTTGEKPEHITFCAPVDFYEFYRAKLQHIASHLDIKSVRTIDEPVAAALGYGLGLDEPKNYLVTDFGAGTLDFALIRGEERLRDQGHCTVIAKEGAPVGGNIIDAWMVEDLCEKYHYSFDRFSADPEVQWWYRILLAEACRVKEALFFKQSETFYLLPSSLMKNYLRALPGRRPEYHGPMDYTREDLSALLEKQGLYKMLGSLIDSVTTSAAAKGIRETQIHEVLMVGGSTLLPNVYSVLEKRFGRDRVRAWQPFNAVAFGAAAYAANRFTKADHITHDYAFVTYNHKSHEPEYNVIVPAGTPFPTPRDFWKRRLVPTCALGEPERIFKLVVCEMGQRHQVDQEFVWDEKGDLHLLGKSGEGGRLIIPLNESDPTLGYLDPSHSPSEKHARIELSFMINEDRWLCATVYDIKTQKYLMTEKPVIRLK